MLPIVNVFTTNPALRETFAVLLEHDCHVEFVRNAAAALRAPTPAVALLAMDTPITVADRINELWPHVPVIAVGQPAAPACTTKHPRHELVPFEPHTIRRAVLQHVRTSEDDALRACAAAVGVALHDDWIPRLQRIRDAAAITNDVDALSEGSHLLRRFLDRPRSARPSGRFVEVLRRALSDRLQASGLKMKLESNAAVQNASGPLELVDAVASLLAYGIRSRTAQPVITSVLNSGQMHVTFKPRSGSDADHVALPFVLAGLALDPWSWQLLLRRGRESEALILCPRGTTTTL